MPDATRAMTVPQRTSVLDADRAQIERVRAKLKAGAPGAVAALVRNAKGEVLLVRHVPERAWGDDWVLPGGWIAKRESPHDAVVREVKEETGLDVEIERPVLVVRQSYRIPWLGMKGMGGETASYPVTFYLCRPKAGSSARAVEGETVEVGWWDVPPAGTFDREFIVEALGV